jgi:thiamine biosynthesis protein ThiS
MMGTAVADAEIALIVNGAERRVPAGSSLADLLTGLSLDPRVVVVEHNGTILRDRATFASVLLSADDTIEIVHFVGGG